MDQNRKDHILSISLEIVKNGLTRLHKQKHSVPATYILYLESSGKYYIGSTGDLYQRIYSHGLNLRRGKHWNGSFQKDFSAADRKEAYEIEQLLFDEHFDSGLLYNVFNNAEVNGHGGKWSQAAKEKQSEVGKRNAETGKLKRAWASTSKAVSIDGVVYPSMAEASRCLGVSPPILSWRVIAARNPRSKYHGIYYCI